MASTTLSDILSQLGDAESEADGDGFSDNGTVDDAAGIVVLVGDND